MKQPQQLHKIADKQANEPTTANNNDDNTQRKYCKMHAVARLLPLPLPASLLVLGLLLDASLCHSSNYNSVYNEVITPELKQAIDKELPKQAKFFDELDCK